MRYNMAAPNGIATFNAPQGLETNAEELPPPQRHRRLASGMISGSIVGNRLPPPCSSLNTSVSPWLQSDSTPATPPSAHHRHTHEMRPATVEKWLMENANAPPPPATPAGLPDDTVSTVYPESSVSNPYASRYTGTRHRSIPFARGTHPQPSYIERRPLSAQAHHRDHHQPIYVAPPSRPRHNSFSADARYIPSQPQPFAYTYTPPQANQTYYAPASAHHTRNQSSSRDASHRTPSSPLYRVVSSSPNRADASRSHDSRQYTSHGTYQSTPTITLQTRSSSVKKQPFLRRIFGGIDWGSAPAKSSSSPHRNSSRSSSKSKSHSHSRSSDRDGETIYRPWRGRAHSDGVVYVRY